MTLLDGSAVQRVDLDDSASSQVPPEMEPSKSAAGAASAPSGPRDGSTAEDELRLGEVVRTLLAAALATAGAGLVTGGMFGSWSARSVGVASSAIGPVWTFVSLRAKNRVLTQLLIVPLLLVMGAVALAAAGESPARIGPLASDAMASGRAFRPPVPFDPGWRPIIVIVVGLLGFGAASAAVMFNRPRLGVAIPVPLIALAAMTQPQDAAFVAGASAFLPVIAALAVLLSDDDSRSVDREFELKRAARGTAVMLALFAVLVAVNSADFLFPASVYDPDDKPQKPRAVSLSEAEDRVLFEVHSETGITGPWRMGALDVYGENAFQSVPSSSRYRPLPTTGAVSELRAGLTQDEVNITVRDLGDNAVMPVVAGTTSVSFASLVAVQIDPRYQTIRFPQGRAPSTTYTLRFPPYATDEDLAGATPGKGAAFKDSLAVPKPPPVVQNLLLQAPQNPWLRLDALRQTLLDRVVASGAGTPVDITASRVAEVLEEPAAAEPRDEDAPEGNEASPYEIVATEAMLARWAGIPSRIGFGFDGVNAEGGVQTVRPKNSAQWLEVYFEGFGWVPLIGKPQQAKTSLDPEDVQKFTPEVLASGDVAVKVFMVYERRDARLLYERLRQQLLLLTPWIVLLVGGYSLSPALAKMWRSRRRRQWAAAIGPRAQVAVEYAELRDVAIDLNVGDDFDSPLEYLRRVTPDEEHEELAWLAARTIYSDMATTVTDDDVAAAEELSRSLRRRLKKAQPATVQLLAFVSRASIELPFSTELPNVRVFQIRWGLFRRLRGVLR